MKVWYFWVFVLALRGWCCVLKQAKNTLYHCIWCCASVSAFSHENWKNGFDCERQQHSTPSSSRHGKHSRMEWDEARMRESWKTKKRMKTQPRISSALKKIQKFSSSCSTVICWCQKTTPDSKSSVQGPTEYLNLYIEEPFVTSLKSFRPMSF